MLRNYFTSKWNSCTWSKWLAKTILTWLQLPYRSFVDLWLSVNCNSYLWLRKLSFVWGAIENLNQNLACFSEGEHYKYEWTILSQPEGEGSGTMSDKNGGTLKLTHLTEGLYMFKVSVSSATAFGETFANVTVLPRKLVIVNFHYLYSKFKTLILTQGRKGSSKWIEDENTNF